MLMTGIQITVPHFGLLIPFAISCLTISTPFTSSPCIPAVNKTMGPGFFERSIIIGTLTVDDVCKLATSKFTSLLSPGIICSPKMDNMLDFFSGIYC